MLGKVFGSFIAGVLVMVLALQVSGVSAHGKKHPLTSPVTSPITSPCKPGWGFGDKNHCHFGPPGFFHNHDKDDDHVASVSSHHDNDDHDKGHNHDDDHGKGHH